MTIEKTADEWIIRLPASVDPAGIQRLLDFLTYREQAAASRATAAQVAELAREVNQGWWERNQARLLPES